MNYDPDRSLWLPSRRKFFFLGLAAGVAPFLPDVPALPKYINSIKFEYSVEPLPMPISMFSSLKRVESVWINGERVDPNRYVLSFEGGRSIVTFHPSA